jgi:hypothetical protein
MGTQVFNNNYSLKSITLNPTTPPTIQSNTFVNMSSDVKYYVPILSWGKYRNATNWSSKLTLSTGSWCYYDSSFNGNVIPIGVTSLNPHMIFSFNENINNLPPHYIIQYQESIDLKEEFSSFHAQYDDIRDLGIYIYNPYDSTFTMSSYSVDHTVISGNMVTVYAISNLPTSGSGNTYSHISFRLDMSYYGELDPNYMYIGTW